jgi:DHA3 family tetracycline resistance protein-like MFS transporter
MQHSFEGLDRPGGFARVGLLRPLRSRDFRLLWAGQTVSLVGDGIFLIAMAWTAFELWDSPAALSIIGIAMTVPIIGFLLVGGAVSDRFDRRHVMIAADVGRAVVVGVLAALDLTGMLGFATLAVLVAFYGAATAFFTPAFEAIVPGIVARSELAQANSLDQFVRPAALRLVGPALGGWIVAAGGGGVAFAVDALSFVVSTAAVAAIGPAPAGAPPDRASSTGAAIADGLRFVRRHVWLWGTLLSAAIAYLAFLGPTEALLPFVVKDELHASAAALGLVFAAGGVGAVAAALFMGQRGQPRRDVTFMYACWTFATIAVAGYGLGRSVLQLMLACVVFNALEAAGTIVWATIKQRHVPGALLGRVSSLDWMISIGLLPVSYALTAPVADLVGVRATLVGAAAIGAAATVGALFLPGMRDVEGKVDGDGAARVRLRRRAYSEGR